MAGNGIIEVNDTNFDQDVLKSDTAGAGGLLGDLVWPLPRDRTDRGRIGNGVSRQSEDRKNGCGPQQATPMRYGVRGIPTLLVFKGGQVKEQIVGYVQRKNPAGAR